MTKKIFVNLVLVFALLLPLGLSMVNAAPLRQEELTYTVKLGDNLWTLAEKYLGNGTAYYLCIVVPTNKKADEDETFATIGDPSLIHPGWKLLIPSAEQCAEYVGNVVPTPVPPTPTLTWTGHATGITPECEPAGRQVVFPQGSPVVYTTFDYEGMTDGALVDFRWYRNGDLLLEYTDVVWEVGSDGSTFTYLEDIEEGLRPGSYDVEVEVKTGERLRSFFVVLSAEQVLEALERDNTPEETALILQCAFSIAGMGWLIEEETSDTWLVLGHVHLEEHRVTVEDVYRSVLDLAAEVGMPALDLDLNEALLYLEEDIAQALGQPKHPDSAFYALLNGKRDSTNWEPTDELTVLEAILFAYWLEGGTCCLPVTQEDSSLVLAATTVVIQVSKTKAYIFIGDTHGTKGRNPPWWSLRSHLNNFLFPAEAQKAKDSLKKHFLDKGWDVTIYEGSSATPEEFKKKVEDPTTAAIAFIGHAEPRRLFFEGGDKILDVFDLPDVAQTDGLKEVILLGCKIGQSFRRENKLIDLPSLLVKDRREQAVAPKTKVGPFDIARMAADIAEGTKLRSVDTEPGCFTKLGIWVRGFAKALREKFTDTSGALVGGTSSCSLSDRYLLRNAGVGRIQGWYPGMEIFPSCH